MSEAIETHHDVSHQLQESGSGLAQIFLIIPDSSLTKPKPPFLGSFVTNKLQEYHPATQTAQSEDPSLCAGFYSGCKCACCGYWHIGHTLTASA